MPTNARPPITRLGDLPNAEGQPLKRGESVVHLLPNIWPSDGATADRIGKSGNLWYTVESGFTYCIPLDQLTIPAREEPSDADPHD